MKNKIIIGLTILISLALLSGCSSVKNAENNSTTNSSSASGAQSNGGETNRTNSSSKDEKQKTDDSTKSAEGIESVYTDIASSKCKTIEKNEEEGWIVQMCDGVAGYKLEVSEGDLRATVNVISPSGKKSELGFQQNVSGAFSTLGEKAEWRMTKKDGKSVPFALIVRLNASKGDDGTKNDSFLVVSKIDGDKSCITDVVKPIANANEEARKLADNSAKKPCKGN